MSRTVRCAIYTRKSTEEGLDQAFNSLDAQREACEAYIRSQAGEGWKLLPAHYDDGGYSGGNLDRPAMQKLLADVDAGRIDVIVVYKVDRLTRSLMDFARIVERFDDRGVSFVSVTQAFNTTSSMGRLTLNVLLSFAQFEREVTGERIRDKIAASKAKGMWMGGNLPLGYDLGNRELIINPVEAEQVRHIFTRYVELGSGVRLAQALKHDGLLSKRWTSRAGQTRGGLPYSCGALYHLLQNRLYLGEIVHKGVRHAGNHGAIVSAELFDAVQATLAKGRRKRKAQPTRQSTCHLAGILHDRAGKPMGTTFSYGRGGRLYRYYVEGSLDPKRSPDASRPVRLSARILEGIVQKAVARLIDDPAIAGWDDIRPLMRSVHLNSDCIHIMLYARHFLESQETCEAAAARLMNRAMPHLLTAERKYLKLTIEWHRGLQRNPQSHIVTDAANQNVAMLRHAHRLLQEHSMSPLHPERHRHASAPLWKRQRDLAPLGLLAPDIQKRILNGVIKHVAETLLVDPPLCWADQRTLLTGDRARLFIGNI